MNGRSEGVIEPSGSVRRLLSMHRRIALDSNVLIYLLEDDGVRAETAAAIVDAIAEGDVEGVVASLGLLESLVGPARAHDAARFELAAAAPRDLGLDVVPLDAELAADAAWIRGGSGVGLPDAIHLATARAAGATALVTNDRRLRSRSHLEVVYLDDLAGDDPAG
jgi:predicted nucleic acid-binding protein